MLDKETIRKLPKIDLHRHLDGDVTPNVLLELGKRTPSVKLPADTIEGLQEWMRWLQSKGFAAILPEGFGLVTSLMQTPENLQTVAYEEVRNLAEDGIIYAELRFAPQYHTGTSTFYGHTTDSRLSYRDIITAVNQGLQKGEQEFGVSTRLIICIGREAEPAAGVEVAQAALACLDQRVVALDLACNEAEHPPEKHLAAYELTVNSPLRRTVHAGEFGSQLDENVHTAITHMHADRIGHGRTIAQNKALLYLALAGKIGIEMAPESNRYCGFIQKYEELQIPELMRRGVLVTVNTDDPAMFWYTLSDVLFNCGQAGMSLDTLRDLQLNAVKTAFLGETEKSALREKIMKEYGPACT